MMITKSRFLLAVSVLIVAGFVVQMSAQNPAPAPSSSETGIEGSISLGPTRPGPVREGVPSSRPLADTDMVVTAGDRQIASFKTDAEGQFRVALPPGHYTVSLKGERPSRIGHFGPWEVDVAPGQMQKVTWQCDTGMR